MGRGEGFKVGTRNSKLHGVMGTNSQYIETFGNLNTVKLSGNFNPLVARAREL